MDPTEVMTLAHTLKGAPISCFFVMVILRRAMGASQLATYTGYDRGIVGQALEKLAALGLAARSGYHNSWCLTDKGYQLPLLNGDSLPALDSGQLSLPGTTVENLHSPRSSSGFKLIESVNHEESLKQPQQLELSRISTVEPNGLNPDLDRLTALLIERCGCPRKTAEAAIRAALDTYTEPTWIELDMLRWLAYCLTEHGQGIRSKGHLIASKLSHAEPCPDWFTIPTNETEALTQLNYEVSRLQEKLEQQGELSDE